MGLAEDLQNKISSLDEFKKITLRILNYIPDQISQTKTDREYVIIESNVGSTKKYARPYNSSLFIMDSEIFSTQYAIFIEILQKAAAGTTQFSEAEFEIIDKITYTIQQSIGIALDFLGNQNANRKYVGNRFEELISLIVEEVGIRNKKVVLKIPYDDSFFKCETDFVFSPYDSVRSDSNTIVENEVVVSLKTTSKDRMGKIFIDKLLMSKFVKRDVKVVGIFLNDIQRKGTDKISYTFVSGLFMVYRKFITELDGVYFVDLPPNSKKDSFKGILKKFSEFILIDAKKMLISSA